MISMSIVASPGAAAGYFAKDNYYTREEGEAHSEWVGTLAREIGLKGRVDPSGFRSLLSGEIGGQQLGRVVTDPSGLPRREQRAGYDITFSAPKSVSILAEVFGRSDVRAAHDAAVRTTLAVIERDIVRVRGTQDGVTISALTGRAIFALFHHNASRIDAHSLPAQ